MHHPTTCPPSHRRRRRLLRLLLATVALTLATAASAQAASITVDQDCIERGDPSTGLGFVSGSFTGAPTGPQYYTEFFVSADRNPGDDWTHYGGDFADDDGAGNGTFAFNLAFFYGSSLPDTLWVKGRAFDFSVGMWVPFAEVQVPVCDSDPDTDGDGIVDSVDNCDNDDNPGQENNDGDAQGDACDADDDNDGVADGADNCALVANGGQEDNDGDGSGDACDADDDNDGVVDSVDNCVNDANPGQENNDVDAQGDACDADDDNDGVNDGGDNCQFTANPGQRDDDQDGVGDACDGTFDSSDGKSSGGGWLTTSDGRVNFSSSAKSVDGVMAGNCVVTVGETKIKCLTVDGYFQSATNDRAVFVGSATQDGVATRYRIELTDNGEPGTADHIAITTDAGFAAAGVLGGGNLQVHRGV
jgi:hypothetical protein